MNKVDGKAVELEPLEAPKGLRCLFLPFQFFTDTLSMLALHVGSVSIDELFEMKLKEYLIDHAKLHPTLAGQEAHKITRGPFQSIKTKFGTSLSTPLAIFKVLEPLERFQLPE